MCGSADTQRVFRVLLWFEDAERARHVADNVVGVAGSHDFARRAYEDVIIGCRVEVTKLATREIRASVQLFTPFEQNVEEMVRVDVVAVAVRAIASLAMAAAGVGDRELLGDPARALIFVMQYHEAPVASLARPSITEVGVSETAFRCVAW